MRSDIYKNMSNPLYRITHHSVISFYSILFVKSPCTGITSPNIVGSG